MTTSQSKDDDAVRLPENVFRARKRKELHQDDESEAGMPTTALYYFLKAPKPQPTLWNPSESLFL